MVGDYIAMPEPVERVTTGNATGCSDIVKALPSEANARYEGAATTNRLECVPCELGSVS